MLNNILGSVLIYLHFVISKSDWNTLIHVKIWQWPIVQ